MEIEELCVGGINTFILCVIQYPEESRSPIYTRVHCHS